MKSVDIPGLGTVDFPDNMSDEDIGRTIEKEIMPSVRASAEEQKRIDDYWSGRGDGSSDEPGYLGNLGRGIGERALDLGGGLLRAAGTAGEAAHDWLERNVPLGTIGSPGTPMTEEQIQQSQMPFTGWGNNLAGVDLGYRPGVNFEDVKENWWKIPEFAFQEGVRSIPDMAGVLLNPILYGAARTGEIAQTRAENDGREAASVDDLIKAAPAAAASALLERFGARGMMGLGDDAVRSFNQLPGAMGRAAVREGGTEFAQEISDYTGETLGTRKGFEAGEALERGIAGAVAGAPFGGGVRGVTGAVQVWAQQRGVEPTQENLEAAAAQGDTQAIDILRAAGLMSDEQLANLSPEAAERFAARYQSRLAADQDPVLAAQRTQAAVENRDLEGGEPLSEDKRKYVDKRADYGGPKREDILKAYETATAQVDAAIEAGTLKSNERDLAIRERVVGFIPELDKRQEVDADTLTMMRARVDEILRKPAEEHTPELADEYIRLKTTLSRSKPARVIALGQRHQDVAGTPFTGVDGKPTTGSTEDTGLAQAVNLRGRPNMPVPFQPKYSPHSDEEVAHQQRVMAREARIRQRELARQKAAMAPQPARMPGSLEANGPMIPPAPNQLYGSENRLVQTPADVAAQQQAEQALRLAEYRAGKAGEGIRDVRGAGRPIGGVESQQEIWLHQGRPVERLAERTVPNSRGEPVTKVMVRRYDPRTGQPEFDPELGEAVEYEVPEAALDKSKYAVAPRRSQHFEEPGGALVGKVEAYKVEPHKDARGRTVTSDAVGKTVKPEKVGQRIDEIQGLPRQTYRTTEPDPTVPGAEGPTSGVDPRQFPPDPDGDNDPWMQPNGPVLRATRPEQGAGGDYDYKSGGRGPNMRGDQTTGEASARQRAKAWAEAEKKRRERQWDQGQRGQTKDEQTGEQTDFGKARSRYEGQTGIYSGKPKGVDEDGWPLTDEDGYILSDKGGPIRFEPTKAGKSAMTTRLREMRAAHPDAMIVHAVHPGTETFRSKTTTGNETYFTLQATQPKPPKVEPEQEQEQAAPEAPADPGPQRSLPGPTPTLAPTPDPAPEPDPVPLPDFEPGFAEAPAPETSRNDTGPVSEQRRNDTETTPDRNPEQLVASAEKALRDRQVKPAPKAIARHFEIDEAQAANVLATIAGRSDKVIRQTKDGRFRLTPRSDKQSLINLLASNGGLAPNGDLSAMDLDKLRTPGAGGMLVRKGGMTLDQARELAEEEGFLGVTDDYQSSDIQDLLDALENEHRGSRVKAERTGFGSDRDQMERRAEELGVQINPDWNDAELLIEIGEADAIANADNPTVQAADDLRDVVDAMLVEMGIVPDTYGADFDIPFGDERAGSDQRAREVSQAPEGAPEAAAESTGREAPDVRSGDRAPETRAGDAAEAGRTGERKTPPIERTDQGDQYVLVGQASSRDGKKAGKGPQRKADEGLFAEDQEGPDPRQIDLEEAIAAAKVDEKPTPEPEPKTQADDLGFKDYATLEAFLADGEALKARVRQAMEAEKGGQHSAELAEKMAKTLKQLDAFMDMVRRGDVKGAQRIAEKQQNFAMMGYDWKHFQGIGVSQLQNDLYLFAEDGADFLTPKDGAKTTAAEGADMFGQVKDPDPGLRGVLGSAISDLEGMEPKDLKADVYAQRNFTRRAREAIKFYRQGVEKNGADQYAEEAWRLQRVIAMAGQEEGIPKPLMRELLDAVQKTGKAAAPEAQAEPGPEPEPEVPAKGTVREIDGITVVATGRQDWPWAGGRYVEKGANAGWQPDTAEGVGDTAEEAAANAKEKRVRTERERQERKEAAERWDAAVDQAREGKMPDPAALKALTRFNNGKVLTGEAKTFLRDMGLTAKQADDVVRRMNSTEPTAGGGWLYDLDRVIRAGQNVLDVAEVVRKTPAPKAETPAKPLTVAAGVKRANEAVKADSATDLEREIYSLARDIERRKANKEKLAEAARVAKARWKSGPQDLRMLGGLSQTARDLDNTKRDRDANMEEIKKGEERLKKLVAKLPPNPPKRKARAQLLSRIFGRNPEIELTAEEEAADDAAWRERLEQIAPRAETVADIRRILDENVERGILNKATAKGIGDVLGRIPTDGLKGVRLIIQDRMTAEEREILGTRKGSLGEYITFDDDPDTRVMVVHGRQGSRTAVDTFVHENAHVLFDRISQEDKAAARRIYDSLPISRQALHTVDYGRQERFEEWFAESMVDYYNNGAATGGPRGSLFHQLGGLAQRLYKRIVDTFSNEKALVDAFFSGLERSLGYAGPVSVKGITRRERRGVSTLAILSNPIGTVTGDWKAWRSGYQELARDVAEMWGNRGKRPNRQYAATSFARSFFYSADGEYRAAIGKFNSPTLNFLADTFHAKAGSRQGLDRKLATKLGMKLDSNATFDEAVTRKVSAELQQLDRILRPFRNDKAAMDRIVDLVQRPSARRSDPESKAASEIARMLKGLHTFMKDAGVDVGEIKFGYFPREIDVAAVIKNSAGFVDAATRAYRASGLSAAKAKEAADNWLTNILYGGEGSPVRKSSGGSPSFVQSRVLTKEADAILKDFYQRDPDAILGSYVSRAVKRAEIARRFGDNWKNWGDIEKQIRAEDPAAAGMFDHLRSYAATAAGVQQHNVPGIIRSGSSMVRTVTSLSLLEKSTFSSLAEAIMPALRTGSARDFIPAITKTLTELRRQLKDMPPSVAAELAADIGAIAGSGVNSIMAARFAGGDPLGRAQARVLDTYFRRIGLTQWTDATRVASTERGAIFIRRLARDIAGGGLNPKSSRIYMEEMGIPAGQLDQFVRFVNGFGDDLPTATDLDQGGEMGAAYRTALLRFVDQTVMRPSTTTRPRWASHPIGAVLFQLQAFSYAFSKNVMLRDLRLAKRAFTEEDMGTVDRLMLAWPLLMTLPLLGMTQFLVGELRDWLFMDPERREAQTTAAKVEKAISRAGFLGGFDPYVQMVSGARYQRDPVAAMTGPFLGVLGTGLGALNQYIGNNSPGTNAAERKATEALYDVLLEPLTNMLLGFAPVSPLTALITTGFLPAMRDDFVNSVAGERIGHRQQPVYGLTELLAGKQFEKEPGSWAARG